MPTTYVNGEPLSPSAIEFELSRLVKFYSGHMSESALNREMDHLRERAEQQAIGGILLRHEAERLEIEIDPNALDETLAAMEESCGGSDGLDEALAAKGMDRAALCASIESSQRVDALVAKIVENTPEPTESEIQSFYENNIDQYQEPASADVQHILLRPTGETDADRAALRSRLGELRTQILNGTDMADLARAHSECPSGERSGGRLGRITKGSMVPEFEDAVFALNNGELSDVVETSLGFHLLRVSERQERAPLPLVEVRDKVHELLRHGARGELITEHVTELKEKADIRDA